MALTINLQLREGAEPFRAEDFLGLSNRAEREAERAAGRMKVQALNRKLVQMKPRRPGEPEPDDLPKWARGG
ncbi:MAG TPA: hypothetical protein VFO46_02500 [Candidatus Sulfotelmatobacter sp.]|nr:hypothetical protein [Candidatus Sulfotelmatobacter sp.]